MTSSRRNKLQARLQRISGQVAGIQRMIDNDRYCVDIILQIAAVQSALNRVGTIILGSHMDSCVTEAMAHGNQKERRQKIDELIEVFARFTTLKSR